MSLTEKEIFEEKNITILQAAHSDEVANYENRIIYLKDVQIQGGYIK